MSEELFGPIFIPDQFREAVGGHAWLQAMLDAEGALARAEARSGLVPIEHAEAITRCCDAERFVPEEIGREGRASGNPVPPLVKALTAAVTEEASEETARHVHTGATSQDILDTTSMLIARRTLDLILAEVDGVAAACADLAEDHRTSLMAGRTLMQQALPTTFGLKAAGWLVAVVEVRKRLLAIRESGLAAQLGGAAGTLASLGSDGTRVLREFARELDLVEPVVSWHTSRLRVAELGNVLVLCVGALEKIALDVILLSQTEVAEVSEPSGAERGGSSTLPHKRNPVLSTAAIACAKRVQASTQTLQYSMAQEHERAAGAWHAEWEALSDALSLSGGVAAAMREALEGLQVYPENMRKNLDFTGGLLLAENMTTRAAADLGRLEAHELVQAACQRTFENGSSLKEELLDDTKLREVLTEKDIDAALDPAGYLGSASEFVERALALYREEVET